MWYAGFECGLIGEHDLLKSSRHMPEEDMTEHYREFAARGVVGFRDGLPERYDITRRIAAVPKGVPVIWDACHFDHPIDPIQHIRRIEEKLGEGRWVIAVNEPSSPEELTGAPKMELARRAVNMMKAAPSLKFACCDPFHSGGEDEYEATDLLVKTGQIGIVGVNHYPMNASEGVTLESVLRRTAERYGLPVALTETGWHDGHRLLDDHWTGVTDRRGWRMYVEKTVRRLRNEGLHIVFACWYPAFDQVPWDDESNHEKWPCGYPE